MHDELGDLEQRSEVPTFQGVVELGTEIVRIRICH